MNIGNLYVVSTPIGNIEDITLRALKTLKVVDYIYAEDTRRSRFLLSHYNINTPLGSYRDQNHDKLFPAIYSLLELGKNIALISDSGTPLISDPGFKLISKLKNKGVRIIPIPGPSACIVGLSVSGLPTDQFVFLGFLPKSDKKRRDILTKYGLLDATLIIYESPFRILKLLHQIQETLGNRVICIARELTKKFEDITVFSLKKIDEFPEIKDPKGEFIVLIAKKDFSLS